MESAPEQINQWRIPMDVIALYTRGSRWWIQFDGSGEALCLGYVKPDLQVGETVDVIVRKRNA